MAIINQTHNFIFVHVPKAAGTSITKLLSEFTHYCDLEIGGTSFGEEIQKPYFRRFGLKKHSPAGDIRKLIGAKKWSNFYKFSVVRNPYDRAVSIFNFLRSWEGCPSEIRQEMLAFSSFEEFVISGRWNQIDGPDQIFKPQAFWLTDPDDRDRIIVDDVYRLENLQEMLPDLGKKASLDLSGKILPQLNESRKDADKTDIGSRVILEINKKYHRDFILFGYEKIKPAS